jgi:hypothetical protein
MPSKHSYARLNPPSITYIGPPTGEEKSGLAGGLAGVGTGLLVAGILTLVVLPTFVVTPWIVKAFKPEWPYERRLVAGLAGTLTLGAVTSVIRSTKEA